MNKVTLVLLLISVLMILTVSLHVSRTTWTTDTTSAPQYSDELAHPDSGSGESTENAAKADSYFTVPRQDDQTADERPEDRSGSDAVDSTDCLEQTVDVPNNEDMALPTPLPDGRIFDRGEPPYGYLPTCSPKDGIVPFVPVEPD